MWFIGVEVEQETSAPPPKKNPGSTPALYTIEHPLALKHMCLSDGNKLPRVFFKYSEISVMRFQI